MEILYRNKLLKHSLSIRDDKTLIVLDWLLEFRFSTYSVLSSRIDQTAAQANRFLKMLADKKMIKVFKSAFATGRIFVMLDTNGIGFLQSKGRSTSKAITKEQNIGNYSKLMHDIAIQNIVVDAINVQRFKKVKYVEVIWDRHIVDLENDVRPDALLITSNGQKVCFEIERFRKDTKRIFFKLRLQAEAILSGKYKGVFYFFLLEADKKFYEKLCLQDEWDFIEKKSVGRGKLFQKKEGFKPELHAKGLKNCFNFVCSSLMDNNAGS